MPHAAPIPPRASGERGCSFGLHQGQQALQAFQRLAHGCPATFVCSGRRRRRKRGPEQIDPIAQQLQCSTCTFPHPGIKELGGRRLPPKASFRDGATGGVVGAHAQERRLLGLLRHSMRKVRGSTSHTLRGNISGRRDEPRTSNGSERETHAVSLGETRPSASRCEGGSVDVHVCTVETLMPGTVMVPGHLV